MIVYLISKVDVFHPETQEKIVAVGSCLTPNQLLNLCKSTGMDSLECEAVVTNDMLNLFQTIANKVSKNA